MKEDDFITTFDKKTPALQAEISYYLTYNNYTKPQLALKLGLSPASLYRKIKAPATFTFGEIRELFNVLKLTDAQILEVI